MASITVDLTPVHDFLGCPTPEAWLSAALDAIPLLMIDHANCEKKAAATAMSLLHRHTGNSQLLNKMSRLAREELRHFEQVLKLMTKRGIAYKAVSASRYAQSLRDRVRKQEPHNLVDTLVVGALIEARSCERFAALVPHVDRELSEFYTSLLKSESRHFGDYLALARREADRDVVEARVSLFRGIERELIESEDSEIRFHSGIPSH